MTGPNFDFGAHGPFKTGQTKHFPTKSALSSLSSSINNASLLVINIISSSTGQTRPWTASHTGSIYFNNVLNFILFLSTNTTVVYMGLGPEHKTQRMLLLFLSTTLTEEETEALRTVIQPDLTVPQNYLIVPQWYHK